MRRHLPFVAGVGWGLGIKGWELLLSSESSSIVTVDLEACCGFCVVPILLAALSKLSGIKVASKDCKLIKKKLSQCQGHISR